jgi:hypothetical protein
MAIKKISHFLDDETNREVTVLTDITTSVAEYRGVIQIGIRGPDGMNTSPLPFEIKAESLQKAFKIFDFEAKKAFEAFKKEQEEKMREPKIVNPAGQIINPAGQEINFRR